MSDLRFSDLLDALGADRLRAHMAERRPLHVPATGLDVSALLSRTEFDTVVSDDALPPETVQRFAGYHKLDAEMFGKLTGDSAGSRTTLVATRIDRVLPRLWRLAWEAEQALGERIGIGAILSNGEATGIDLHHDAESLIIVQLKGEKTWRFFGPPVDGSCLPKDAQPPMPADPPVTAELVMRPGDLLFVPSGLRHKCAPGGYSFHLGILMLHQSGQLLLTALRKAAIEDTRPFDPLVRFLGGDAVDAQAEAYKAQLMTLLAAMDARGLLDGKLALRGEAFEPDSFKD